MKSIHIVLFMSFLLSCSEQEGLEGHWHFYHSLEVNDQIENNYTTFDIKEDSLKTLNLLGLSFEETIWRVK